MGFDAEGGGEADFQELAGSGEEEGAAFWACAMFSTDRCPAPYGAGYFLSALRASGRGGLGFALA